MNYEGVFLKNLLSIHFKVNLNCTAAEHGRFFLFCIYWSPGIQMLGEQCLSLLFFSGHQPPSILNGKI